jgi:hypothetical protein
MEDYTLLSRRPLKRRHRYAATSVMDIRPVHAQLRAETYLQLPPGRNPRTLALGRQLARRHTDVDAIVEAGLAFLRDNSFVYSLTPDRLGRDAVDDFLFRSRNGFCEHFATAYAVLMRAAGVPARVVGGYQGGRWNSLGEFLTVRQTDAHAWCEVWRPERGWTRVDPTLVVAPDRIGNGLEAVAGAMQGYFGRQGEGWLGPWIEGLRLTWEAVDTRWQMAFMAFSADEQMTFLARLGLSAGRHGRLALVAMVTLLFVGMVFFVKRWRYPTRRAARVDEALIIYRRFLSKMNRIGLPKPPHQGPWDYSRAVITRQPVLMADVEAITRRYIQLRYASQGDATGLDAFRRQVRAFRPRRLLADRADRVDVFPPPHSAH